MPFKHTSHLLFAAVFALTCPLGPAAWSAEPAEPADAPAPSAADAPAASADAPAEPDTPAGHSQHGEAFNEGPRQAAYLMGGCGPVHFSVTATDPYVQRFIDQGIGQLHGFWYLEAERSFRQAAMIDPDCAIAYWGMAMANTNNAGRAKKFLAEAVARKDHASERERMYIDALDDFYKESNRKKRNKDYIAAFEKIAKAHPDDLEAKAWLGYALYKYRSDSGKSYDEVDAALKAVLAEEPLHPVHHYRIHLWDYKDAAKALDSAASGGPSSPAIAHMWHMPGHIYSRLKRYEDAVYQQEASARVDHDQMMRDRLMPDQIHNFAHNNEWLVRNLIHVGRWRDALDLATNMTELPRHPKYNTLSRRGSAQYGRTRLFDVLSQFELWRQTIELANSPHLEPTDDEDEQVKRLRHLGVAYAAVGEGDNARGVIGQLRARLDDLKRETEPDKPAEKAEEPECESEETPTPGGDAPKAGNEAQEPEATEKNADDEPANDDKPKAEEPEKAEESGKDEEEKKTPEQKRAESEERQRIARIKRKTEALERAIAAIEGRMALVAGDYGAAASLLKDANEDKMLQARVQCLVGETDAAVDAARDYVKGKDKETIPWAGWVEVLWHAGREHDARQAFETLRSFSGPIQFGSPAFDRLAPIAAELGLPEDWRIASKPADDIGERPEIDSLGPFRWRPSPAPAWSLNDSTGRAFALEQFRGKPVVVIFYLGHGCLHCTEQLQAFAPAASDFRAAGIELIAISTDSSADLKLSVETYKGGMPFPLVSNDKLDVFKAYRAFDDFENTPLHGTFVIDERGLVRWQDISYEPFMDPSFVLEEAQRLLAQGRGEMVTSE